jgi:maleylacetate reductase
VSEAFRHVDRDQTIIFGCGCLGAALEEIGTGFTLLSTARARAAVPELAERAAVVVDVPAGLVEDVAAALRGAVGPGALVACGGGRVIDAAKAIAAAERRPGPVAIPTSLSGAEMTGGHRHARGVPDDTPRSRASAVINDPLLSASQPLEALAASSANALGHATTALPSRRATPIARTVAREAIAGLTRAWAAVEPDREGLALAALLAGWALDRTGIGPHHALSQTAVRVGGAGHAQANAALLPHTLRALRGRAPELAGDDLERLADTLRSRAALTGLGAMGEDPGVLERAVQTAIARPELDRIPPALTADEVRAIYRAAAGA